MKNNSLALLLLFFLHSSWAYDTSKAGYAIDINGEINEYTIFSIFVLPNQAITIRAESNLDLKSESVTLLKTDIGLWTGTAPKLPGWYSIVISSDAGKPMKINVLVLTPISQKNGEYLNGYRIGYYPAKPLNGNEIYKRPEGFFECHASELENQLSPHFKVSQFMCKQASDYPKYLIVSERLLLKLEYLLEQTNNAGFAIETFGFVSGYRTPYYNKSIKNVPYSRHVYGGAADIFIDQDLDGYFDDLNNDQVTNEKDVEIFHQLIESQYNLPEYEKFRGGLGFYKNNGVHKGFIHVDVRGTRARWGHP